jgi:hypothetical protein
MVILYKVVAKPSGSASSPPSPRPWFESHLLHVFFSFENFVFTSNDPRRQIHKKLGWPGIELAPSI